MGMTLDEAIAKTKKIAETQRLLYEDCILKEQNTHFLRQAKEHEQFAEWLEELKSYRENANGYNKEDIELNRNAMYNKAIDDFVKGMKKYMETTEQASYIDEINEGNDNYSAMTIYDYVDELAEQLKDGEENE